MTQAAIRTDNDAPSRDGDAIVQLENIRKYFPITKGVVMRRAIGQVKAVDGVSFRIREGETYSLVGEIGLRKNHDGPDGATG